jgi:hypothetical protein
MTSYPSVPELSKSTNTMSVKKLSSMGYQGVQQMTSCPSVAELIRNLLRIMVQMTKSPSVRVGQQTRDLSVARLSKLG